MTRLAITVLLIAAAAIALLLGATYSYEAWRTHVHQQGDRAGAARVKAEWDADTARLQAEAIEAARRSAAETLRRLNVQQENQRAQDQLLARARADRDRAVARADGLRLTASTYLTAAGCGSLAGAAAVECISKAAAHVVDVLGMCGRAVVRFAAAADDARARGLKCEADYDGLDAPLQLKP